jgi:ATP-dependent Clp protease ATP-binding subunit ClpC
MSELNARGEEPVRRAAGRGVRSLAESVRREPLSVVLFDEVEKAASDAFDVLLGILGEGRLTDALGRFVDFRMTLIVMTSNLGVRASGPVGFGGAATGEDFLRAVRDHFRPEFVGRIDQLVPFSHLAPEDVRKIVDLQLALVEKREGFARRGIRIEVSADARTRLAELGYDRRFGARPLKRVIEAHVVTPIAVRLSADPKLANTTLHVGTTSAADVVV